MIQIKFLAESNDFVLYPVHKHTRFYGLSLESRLKLRSFRASQANFTTAVHNSNIAFYIMKQMSEQITLKN